MIRAFLTKRKRRVQGRLVTATRWSIRYRLQDEKIWRYKPLHVRDKQVAENLLSKFVVQQEQESAGVVPPRAIREALTRSLSDHLGDLENDLETKGRASMYVYNVCKMNERLFIGCVWKTPADVTADSFITWRSSQVDLAPKTLNEYLNVANVLFNWMARHGRIIANPLRSVEKVDTRGREVRKRRALTIQECRRLLALGSPYVPAYTVALATGLRRGELRSLTWGDVHLDALRPFVCVRANVSKNRRKTNMPLRLDAVAALRRINPENASDADKVFPYLPSMDEFRADLDAAEIAHKEDAQGRIVDFHSLRHTLATMLSLSHVAPREAMEIMRHSDLRLTMKTYTDAGQLAIGDALDKLPELSMSATKPLAVAVGAEFSVSDRVEKLTHTLTHGIVRTGLDKVGQPERNGEAKNANRPVIPGELLSLSSKVPDSPGEWENRGSRIRT